MVKGILEKGTVIHVNGIPFELKEDAIIEGNKNNFKIAGLVKK